MGGDLDTRFVRTDGKNREEHDTAWHEHYKGVLDSNILCSGICPIIRYRDTSPHNMKNKRALKQAKKRACQLIKDVNDVERLEILVKILLSLL